jgi:hypothetical protein
MVRMAEDLRRCLGMASRIRPIPRERPSSRVEILIGRSLAMSVHPTAAWRVLPPSRRALMILGYFAVSYLTVLSGLLLS